MKVLSTANVTKQAGVTRQTLERWIGNGEIPAPRTICAGRAVVLEWTRDDLERVLQTELPQSSHTQSDSPVTVTRLKPRR